ncbi:MAG TPA: methyltransferase [Ferruginibacter sp.]|nr:methyltransferase [Ferruginibacter sp.]
MNTVIKHIVARTYKPLLVRYLSKTRSYRYKDIMLEIPPGVFHPGFFFSTQLLLQYISNMPLNAKHFLELGCGSGLISLVAAKNGAIVTASDINPLAIDSLKNNSRQNKIKLEIIGSDLFENLTGKYDVIAINPPYYKQDPVTYGDHAWFCGSHGEYFSRLFASLDKHIHNDSEVLMVLFDGCDLEMIKDFAITNHFRLNCVYSKQNMLEKNFIYKIEKIS